MEINKLDADGVSATFKEFLEEIPPGQRTLITDFNIATVRGPSGIHVRRINFPDIKLYCPTCNGERRFMPVSTIPEHLNTFYSTPQKNVTTTSILVLYVCVNCPAADTVEQKNFAFQVYTNLANGNPATIDALKIGEFPPFGPPIAPHLEKLLGDEIEYYRKGHRAESQGLGIAAFAYYRRVVENQKNKIFDKIICVAQKSKADLQLISDLNAAKSENQFTKSIELIKHGLPTSLLVDGHHNPLTALHSALSEGIHGRTDEQCLENAGAIRLVLADLAERLSNTLKNHEALTTAVNKLFAKVPKPKKG